MTVTAAFARGLDSCTWFPLLLLLLLLLSLLLFAWKRKEVPPFTFRGKKSKVLIKLLWNNIILFSFTLTILVQSHFNRLCKSEFVGRFSSLNSPNRSIPCNWTCKARQDRNNIYFIKVSLALSLAEDKGEECFIGSLMRYYCIQIFRNKTQKSKKPSGIALKGMQNYMDLECVEKWLKCTELLTALGFYFLCELYLNKNFIIASVVHATIVKVVSISSWGS